jgi:hypothetical protein
VDDIVVESLLVTLELVECATDERQHSVRGDGYT